MLEEGTRVDRLVSIDVVERFEALQDEVDLMKNEIKQTLIDLREHMMKGRTVFSQPEIETPHRTPSALPARVALAKDANTSTGILPANGRRPAAPTASFAPSPSVDGMDPRILGSIINWLGTVKQMGVSLQQVTPFLEAYEASGYLSAIMLKVLLRSLADLDQMTDVPEDDEFSPERYAECIGQLHDIICPPDSRTEENVDVSEPYQELFPENPTEIVEHMDSPEEKSDAEISGRWPSNGVDPAANGYNLTTIQVPEFQEDEDSTEEGGMNG
ncbi:MAG: hypothetical protein H8E48_02670 [Chloroflexi bacterium]|nr:hypothetical protein [Chloroflexota bacterium]